MKKLLIKFALPALILGATNTPALAEVVSKVEAASSFTIAVVGGIKPRTESYPLAVDLRWLSFRNRILAVTGEFNYAKSPAYNRAAFQQTRIGVQYYPFALGAGFEDTFETLVLKYDAFMKPYVGGSFGMGRFFVEPVDSKAAAELSSDYVIFSGALGSALQFSQSFSMDLALDAGFAMGTSAIAFSALLIRPRVGFLMAL
jgi:hypothetical protein